MLKPLLRTLPTLSGNVKIGCTLSDYNKITNTEYTAYVRIAKLLPLTSSLSQRNCDVNLLYSTYDYDLQRFYKYYSSYFYDDVFEYNKSDYILIDKSEAQKNRNTEQIDGLLRTVRTYKFKFQIKRAVRLFFNYFLQAF